MTVGTALMVVHAIAADVERCVGIVAAAVDSMMEWVAVASVAGCNVIVPGFEAVAILAAEVVAAVRWGDGAGRVKHGGTGCDKTAAAVVDGVTEWAAIASAAECNIMVAALEAVAALAAEVVAVVRWWNGVDRVERSKTGCNEAIAAAVDDATDWSAVVSAAECNVVAAALEAVAALAAACVTVLSWGNGGGRMGCGRLGRNDRNLI
jgi:hypothetical protein